MDVNSMRERIVTLFSKVFFGEQYLNGYAAEMPQEEKEYRLTGLFPNEVAKTKVINVLQKESTLKMDNIKR